MAKLIIGIHGLANKPTPKIEKESWSSALQEGLKKNCRYDKPFEFKMVYWANVLYKFPLHEDPHYDFDQLYNAEPYLPAKPGALKTYEESLKDRILDFGINMGEKALEGVKSAFGWDRLADQLLTRKLKDLAFYYDEKRRIVKAPGSHETAVARIVLQNILKQALLKNKNKDIMLISHFMGTIISYNVLRDLGRPKPQMYVPWFVSLGSPLGLPHVKDKIIEEREYDPIVRTPTIVQKSWKNFADRSDPVAVDAHLADDYKPNLYGVTVEDDLIANDYISTEGKNNHHKIFGYLRAPEVSEHVKSFLTT